MPLNDRTFHDNIFKPMFELAFGLGAGGGIVHSFKTDLAYDVITLMDAPAGSVWAWGPREGGTHLMRLDGNSVPSPQLVATMSVVPYHWHIIRIGDPWPSKHTAPRGTIENLGSCTMSEVASRMGSILLELAMPKKEAL